VPVISFEGDSRRESQLSRLVYEHLRMALPSELGFYLSQIESTHALVIHCHFGTDARFFLGALRDLGASIFVSYYGYDVSSFVRSFLGLGRFYLAPLWGHSVTHLAMTPQMAVVLASLGAPPDRIRIHHHGIDTAFWEKGARSGDGNRPCILQVGSLHKKKGQDDLLKAFALVRRKQPQARLRLVGQGPQERYLRRLAVLLGIEDAVTFVGHLPHGTKLRQEYANATVFCHPSCTAPDGDKEGLPGTILEAMACGLAVVSTLHAGIPYAVRDGKTGWLVREGDIRSLAAALDDALSNGPRRVARGSAARSLVEREFDVRVQAQRLESLYDEAVSGQA
jgi:glycosyltransferase involved in cell wall biosynthesis